MINHKKVLCHFCRLVISAYQMPTKPKIQENKSYIIIFYLQSNQKTKYKDCSKSPAFLIFTNSNIFHFLTSAIF